MGCGDGRGLHRARQQGLGGIQLAVGLQELVLVLIHDAEELILGVAGLAQGLKVAGEAGWTR